MREMFDAIVDRASWTARTGNLWVVVLVEGDAGPSPHIGGRLYDYERPLPFRTLDCEPALVEQSLPSACSLAEPCRVVVVAPRRLRAEAAGLLRDWQDVHLLEQPRDSGTLPGLLLALLHILPSDPEATVVLVPCLRARDREVIGAARDAADLVASQDRVATVGDDVVVARARVLAALVRQHAPHWWAGVCENVHHEGGLDWIYRYLPPADLSRDVLERVGGLVGVQPQALALTA